jgi:hypothetical protein
MKVMQAHELTCKINGSGTAIDCDCYLSRIPKGVLTASGQAQVAVPPKPASTRATAGEQSEPIKALNPLFDSNLAVPSKGEGLEPVDTNKMAKSSQKGDNGGSEASPLNAEALRKALEAVEVHLTNLQPHIPQACYPKRAVFIDNYVNPCLEICRAALKGGVASTEPPKSHPEVLPPAPTKEPK